MELNIDKSTQYVALWTHKRHPIPRPFGRATECLLWVLQQKMIVLQRVSTVYHWLNARELTHWSCSLALSHRWLRVWTTKGKLWGVFCVDWGENWLHFMGIVLNIHIIEYFDCASYHPNLLCCFHCRGHLFIASSGVKVHFTGGAICALFGFWWL